MLVLFFIAPRHLCLFCFSVVHFSLTKRPGGLIFRSCFPINHLGAGVTDLLFCVATTSLALRSGCSLPHTVSSRKLCSTYVYTYNS